MKDRFGHDEGSVRMTITTMGTTTTNGVSQGADYRSHDDKHYDCDEHGTDDDCDANS